MNIYTIPQGCSFLENLAIGLLKTPEDLSRTQIFLPSRRACHELKRALMRANQGQCLLLPKMTPLGDLDATGLNLPPIIDPLRRLGLLAKLIEDYTHKTGLPHTQALSFKLAKSLVKLLDQAAIENIPWDNLHQLVPAEFAGHWQLTLDFLDIITTHWPKILAERGVIEPYTYHHQLVDHVITRLNCTHPILAAGSTGTMPATAKLLLAIADLPNGAVILPGLDRGQETIPSPCHPQYSLMRFLEKANLTAADVPLWPPVQGITPHPRVTLLAQALKPEITPLPQPHLDGLSYLPCATSQEEALAIALLIRQHLETPDIRIALVTADVRLAERVEAELNRWDITIDNSFGTPLDRTPVGILLQVAATEYPNFAALKHHVTTQAPELWEGPIKALWEGIEASQDDFPSLDPSTFPDVLKELLRGQNVRSLAPKHPRLAIIGSIEARLFHADVMILGGLNEGSWPPEIEVDPWLNRPMRHTLGFPSPERRIGLAAHDFTQAMAHPIVYLTRALKVDGTPTLACRWLERLETYLKGCGTALPQATEVLAWAQALDRPAEHTPRPAPFPMPPLVSRPRRLSVTQVETWMRDPYALYARTILDLKPLDPLIPEIGPAEMGTLTHATLEHFFKAFPDPCVPDALEGLRAIADELAEPYKETPSIQLFWRPRFAQFAQWLVEHERATRLPGTKTFTEIRGKLVFTTPHGPFECTAKADRIDLLPDGRLRIIDYKTGAPPSDQDVLLGFSPQLPLEGAIAIAKGFEGLHATQLESLQYWWVRGDAKGSVIRNLPGDPHKLSTDALAGLKRMVALFENPTTPYPTRPVPAKALRYNDYKHLARGE